MSGITSRLTLRTSPIRWTVFFLSSTRIGRFWIIPQCIRRKHGGMIQNIPILVDDRKKTVHLIGDVLKVRREVIPDIDWLFAVAPSKLGNIRDSRVIQGPKRVFIEKLDALLQANFNAVRQ